MTPARAPAIAVLMVGFPLLSFVLLKSGWVPPDWLGLPNGVFAVGLLLGLCVEGGVYALGAAMALGVGLGVMGLALWPGPAVALFPVAVNLLVGRLFQSTLRPGSEPLITRIARLARGAEPMAEELVGYTRRLTAAWAGLFFLLALNALLLAVFASTETALLFANSLNYGLMALLFVGEYGYRRYRYPHHRHSGFLTVIRTLLRHGWLIPENTPESRADLPKRAS